MKHSLTPLSLFAATAAFAIGLPAATAPAQLHERYVTGLAIIAETQAATNRMNQTLDLIENGAEAQTGRVTTMESRLFDVDQSTKQLVRQGQSLTATTQLLLERMGRIDTRFTTLEHALSDDRSLLTKSTEIISNLVAAAEKSGSTDERDIAEEYTDSLKEHATRLRSLADQLAQTRQRISLERTLFDGLQPHLANSSADLKTVSTELAAATERVAKQRATLADLHANLDRDRTNLSKQYAAFGIAVEGFRVTQVDVLRRWLLDGPPPGDLPALSINDVVEASLPPDRNPNSLSLPDPATTAMRSAMNADAMSRGSDSYGAASAPGGSQISAEFVRLTRQARWCLAMLQRLETFAQESLTDANGWVQTATNWRLELTGMNRSIAELRGELASLQLEQDMIASTIKLVAKQAGDTTNLVAETAKQIAAQTGQLSSLTAELKRMSAD